VWVEIGSDGTTIALPLSFRGSLSCLRTSNVSVFQCLIHTVTLLCILLVSVNEPADTCHRFGPHPHKRTRFDLFFGGSDGLILFRIRSS